MKYFLTLKIVWLHKERLKNIQHTNPTTLPRMITLFIEEKLTLVY